MFHQPGQRAPHSGVYEQVNACGGPSGAVAYVQEGDQLPPAPRGLTWQPLARRSPAALREEAIEYRRLAESASTANVTFALFEIANRFDDLAEQCERDGLPDKAISAVDALISEINQTAAVQPRPLDVLMVTLKLSIAMDTDPYLLAGGLIEGIAIAIAKQIPSERHGEVARDTMRLLRDRMRTYNLI
jgi:hypothetical protein